MRDALAQREQSEREVIFTTHFKVLSYFLLTNLNQIITAEISRVSGH